MSVQFHTVSRLCTMGKCYLHVTYSHRVFTVQQMIARACVCGSLAWLWRRSSRHSNAVWNREHTKSFLATFTKSGGAHAHALARLPPSGRGTNRPRLSTRPYTQGAGKGDTHWAPLWHTATVVHHVHASTSLRAAKPRRAVGLPQHQEGGVPVQFVTGARRTPAMLH